MIKNIKKFRIVFLFILLIAVSCEFVGCDFIFDDTTDDSEWVNKLSSDGMQANVMIFTTSIDTGFFAKDSTTFFGSGVIFDKSDRTYYVLTNNHVVFLKEGYSRREISVHDFKGEEYSATLIYSDPKYDLALLSFTVSDKGTGTVTYAPLTLATKNSPVNNRVAAMGQPHGQYNCLTLGKIEMYAEAIALEDSTSNSSDINFDIMYHTAPIDKGSSGGVVLDKDLKIVGINYSSAFDQNQNYAYSCAVPVEKILEFLANSQFYNSNIQDDN